MSIDPRPYFAALMWQDLGDKVVDKWGLDRESGLCVEPVPEEACRLKPHGRNVKEAVTIATASFWGGALFYW